MNTIGRLIPSLESQVNLKNFRGVSTSDALYRMSGVRITGLLGSITAIYGFSIDIFEDIQKEIEKIDIELNRIRNKAESLMNGQIEKENQERKEKEEREKKRKDAEKREKERKEREKKGREDKEKDKNAHSISMKKKIHTNRIVKYDKKILNDDETIIREMERKEHKRKRKVDKEKDKKISDDNETIIKDEGLGKDYSYEFAYEYQYSLFEDECLKNVLEQRAKKYNFSSYNSNSDIKLINEKSTVDSHQSLFEDNDLKEFASVPISKNKY